MKGTMTVNRIIYPPAVHFLTDRFFPEKTEKYYSYERVNRGPQKANRQARKAQRQARRKNRV